MEFGIVTPCGTNIWRVFVYNMGDRGRSFWSLPFVSFRAEEFWSACNFSSWL